ncbi:MAG: M14 family metallopeptidase [Lachnospiraceae bacterium]|nr:succinylglutamate desuccinylase/aspartoacylase family protein [Lachnospiraceae bacterium]MEE1014413.1 M14 family metallopeptidase [Lachnospiraceae bacterium]
MEKKIIYEISSLYRDNFRVTGFEFGEGEKSVCIVGNLRGNEVQQIYTCSQLVQKFKVLEKEGKIRKGHKVLIIPSMNPYSMNSKERFWPTDKTDINRMFPGYDLGETTQRIAAGIFEVIKDYKYGMQFASFYMPGKFMPHVRMMQTGFENVEMAKEFGMPYVVLRKIRPYDTTTLNYNWQIWETNAFSIYTTSTTEIDKESAKEAIRGILRFLAKQQIIEYTTHEGYKSSVVTDSEMISVRTKSAGIFDSKVKAGEEIAKGQILAQIIDPLEGEVKENLISPVDGIVFFGHNDPLTYANTAVFKIISGGI